MRTSKDKAKRKEKNVTHDPVQGMFGKLYMLDQKLGEMNLPYKSKRSKRERKKAKLKHKEGTASKKNEESPYQTNSSTV